MTEEEFTQWVQKTHKEHKWQSHKIAELYSKVQMKKALEPIERMCDNQNPSHENIWRYVYDILKKKQ